MTTSHRLSRRQGLQGPSAAAAAAFIVIAGASSALAQTDADPLPTPESAPAPALSPEETERLEAAGFSFAPESPDAPFTPEAAALVARIDAYLNTIDTVRARFTQTVVDVSARQTVMEAAGEMLLDRPGRFRFSYDPPHVDPAVITSDGSIVQLDYPDLGQSDQIALRATPLHLFVKKDVNLRRDAAVTWVAAGPNEIAASMSDPTGEVDGSLTLLFAGGDDSLELKGWEVLDGAGLLTRTTLVEAERDVRLQPSLFRVSTPERRRGGR